MERHAVWEIVFLMLILKIPIVYLCCVVYWAIKAEPKPEEGAALLPVVAEPDPRPGWSWQPRLDRPRRGGDLVARRPGLGQLPEQPHRCRRSARILRTARGARRGARLPARERRGLFRAVVRRASGVGSAGGRPSPCRRVQLTLQA